jgi:hypothetical protein
MRILLKTKQIFQFSSDRLRLVRFEEPQQQQTQTNNQRTEHRLTMDFPDKQKIALPVGIVKVLPSTT